MEKKSAIPRKPLPVTTHCEGTAHLRSGLRPIGLFEKLGGAKSAAFLAGSVVVCIVLAGYISFLWNSSSGNTTWLKTVSNKQLLLKSVTISTLGS